MADALELLKARKKIVKDRAVIKGKITSQFALMNSDDSRVNIASCKSIIEKYLSKIEEYDSQIIELSEDFSDDDIPEDVSKEIEKQSSYVTDVHNKLSQYVDADNKSDFQKSTNCKLKLPDLKCDTFSGEGTSLLEFHSFFSQFNNLVGLRTNLSDSTKLSYLRSYLRGYALKLVQHLQICDDNYSVCVDLLKSEFLNEEALVDDLLRKFLNLKPKFDTSYHETKLFLGEIRCVVSDLKLYDFDFMEDKSGNKLISHIIFNKLSPAFQQELVRKLNDNYPTLKQILDNYVEVIRTLKLKSPKNPKDEQDSITQPINRVISRSTTVSKIGSRDVTKFCKFCTAPGHNMLNCDRYVTYDARKKRCLELRMCIKCSSQKHKAVECNRPLDFPCYKCNSKSHITALCEKNSSVVSTNFCVNSSSDSGQNFLLPVVNLRLSVGKRLMTVRCLLDTGSQRSYLSNAVVDNLGLDLDNKTNLVINTFIDSDNVEFCETAVTVELGDKKFVIPFLINDSFHLTLNINGLKESHANISKYHDLHDHLTTDEVVLNGLIGVDVLQCLEKLELVSCMNGAAFKLSTGLIPFGNVDSFLTRKQLQDKYASEYSDVYSSSSAIVNLVLNPVKINFDPVGSVLKDSSVDDRLDNMFSLESLGIVEDSNDYDAAKISEFESNIQLHDGSYFVNLPWNDKILQVQNNYNIALAILNRVVSNLHKDNLYEDYNNVITKQLDDNILEEIPMENLNITDHVFVPHRPVVKMESNVTTKVRLVLNCSFKTGDAPSLNEAAYPGVDLVNNLFQLLVKIRANSMLVLSDIKAAFLMIRLNLVSDRNKFTILWKSQGKIVAYRYCSIVFGFISSPFMLQCVIRHHLRNYPNDEYNEILKSGMYVDNLFFTGDDVDDLMAKYKETSRRLLDGGFTLRSWSSNSCQLRDAFKSDDVSASSSNEWEKLLGYKYFPLTDTLMINSFDSGSEVYVTKRFVLSYTSKIFDPLGLALPIFVKAKLFIRSLWQAKCDWDEQINAELLSEWIKIKKELDLIPELSFERSCYSGELTMFLCCDSSKLMYGFCCYVKNVDGSSPPNLIFAKAKCAPSKSKSIPTLELFSVYLALRCLPSVLDSLNNMVKEIYVCIDAQVVLTWVLTGEVKSKNICARNRVKDVTKFREDIYSKYGLDCKFKYLSTDQNPADLLTRGISFKEYELKKSVWLNGPGFLQPDPIVWPHADLGCLSDKSRVLTFSMTVTPPKENIFPIEKFSDMNKLLRVTSLVIKFVNLLRRSNRTMLENMNAARLYWIKTEQSKYFSNEVTFLKNPTKKNVPNLIKNLNLFLDENNVLRSRGRLTKCNDIGNDVNNPVLLPKESHLTDVVIEDVHRECKHLGVPTTLVNVRKRGFWIPKGRQVVKTVLSKCVICKKINSYPFKYPKTNDYVGDKVNFVHFFEHTGIDYTGHVFVKHGDKLSKMYILVFTCLNIRAIHLELLPDMSCANFLLSFIRFCNIYRTPSAVYSDNASTFLQAMGIISESYSDNEFCDYLVRNNIRHIRIPLYAAWIGAAWERMIRTIKSSIHKVVGRRHLPYFQILTFLSDLTNYINSRPLTYVNNDVDLKYISPNSFLKFETGSSLLLDGTAGGEIVAPSRKDLVRSLQVRDDWFQAAKDIWIEEYLLSLRESSRDLYQDDWVNRIAQGDIVLISSPKSRPLWKMGRVVELLPGSDGIVRTVKIVRPDRSEGVYPINLLYPLELSIAPILVLDDQLDDSEPDEPVPQRPRRAAAEQCMARIRNSN